MEFSVVMHLLLIELCRRAMLMLNHQRTTEALYQQSKIKSSLSRLSNRNAFKCLPYTKCNHHTTMQHANVHGHHQEFVYNLFTHEMAKHIY